MACPFSHYLKPRLLHACEQCSGSAMRQGGPCPSSLKERTITVLHRTAYINNARAAAAVRALRASHRDDSASIVSIYERGHRRCGGFFRGCMGAGAWCGGRAHNLRETHTNKPRPPTSHRDLRHCSMLHRKPIHSSVAAHASRMMRRAPGSHSKKEEKLAATFVARAGPASQCRSSSSHHCKFYRLTIEESASLDS